MEQKVDIVIIYPKEFLKIDIVANFGSAVRPLPLENKKEGNNLIII